MKIGDKFQCTIESVAFGGDGVARVENMVVFIPFVLPGETVIAKIRTIKRDYLRARAVEILTASPERITPVCPLYNRCPGCVYQHSSFKEEQEIKLSQLKQLLHGVVEMENITASTAVTPENALHYRNKIVLHTLKDHGETLLGYVGRDVSETVDVKNCPLACQAINDELAVQRNKPGFDHSIHAGMDVTFRYTPANGVLMWRNNPPKNLSWLKEELPFGCMSVPAGSFTQVNPVGMKALVELLQAEIKRMAPEKVIDAYCGAGLFGLAAGLAGAAQIVAVEADEAAVQAANYNFKQYNLADHAVAHAGDAGDELSELLIDFPESGVLIVDPPRGGLTPKVRAVSIRSNLKRMIYISCNPSTLNRDLHTLESGGFKVVKCVMINMFPRSSHFEVFTVLER